MRFSIVFLLLVCTQYLVVGQQKFNKVLSFSKLTSINYASGLSVADFDRDGDLDVFIVATESYHEAKPETWNRLLRNDPGGFVDVTDQTGLLLNQYNVPKFLEEGIKMGASWGDFDNDGFPDLFLTNHGYDQLWSNNGDGTFDDVTAKAHVAGGENAYSSSALWWDYDIDGDLDLYVSRWVGLNSLYRNDGNGVFADVSTESGLEDVGTTWTSIPFDVNKDGLPDLYIVNDYTPSLLYLNDGNGRFSEATNQYRLGDSGNGMGVDICDFKGDGDFDIYVTNISQITTNPFFVNEGEKFREQASKANIGNAAWGWSCRFFDMDHDSDEDLFVVNQRFFENGNPEYNRLFELEGERFEERASFYGLDSYLDGRGMEVFDYNKDGDLDILVGNWDGAPILYDNAVNDKGNWIQLELEGTASNRDAFGAIVMIKTKDGLQHRLHHGANFLGQSIKPLHFGLGQSNNIEEMTIFWPSGITEQLYNIPVKQILKIKEGENKEIKNASYGTKNSQTITSIQFQEPFKIKVYPNPINNNQGVFIQSNKMGVFEISISGLLGRKVFYELIEITNDEEINLVDSHEWPTGSYFVSIVSGEERSITKLIKF